MASTLTNYDFEASRRNGREVYDWEHWFDGQIWKLVPHETKEVPTGELDENDVEITRTETVPDTGDFPGPAEDFRTTCYSASKRRGVLIRTSVDADGDLILQKIGDRPKDAPKS